MQEDIENRSLTLMINSSKLTARTAYEIDITDQDEEEFMEDLTDETQQLAAGYGGLL